MVFVSIVYAQVHACMSTFSVGIVRSGEIAVDLMAVVLDIVCVPL